MPTTAQTAAVRSEFERRRAAWLADLAAMTRADEAQGLAQRALGDEKLAEKFVGSMFTGTLPPPPWPAHPALTKAVDEMKIHRDAAEVLRRRAPAAKYKDPTKVRAAMKRTYAELAKQVGVMLSALEDAPTGAAAVTAAAAAAGKAALRAVEPGSLFGVPIIVLLILWVVLHSAERDHFEAA